MSEEQKFNLIDCSGISDVANNLIDKLTSGAGWIASRKTPAKIAVNTYIEDIQNSNYDPLTKAALISRAKKTIKEYCNQKDIVEVALASLQTEGRFEEVDDDWIAVFMDKARLISNKEVQKYGEKFWQQNVKTIIYLEVLYIYWHKWTERMRKLLLYYALWQ